MFFKFTNKFHSSSAVVGLGDPIEVDRTADGRAVMVVVGENKVLDAAGKFICTNWRNPGDCLCGQELSPAPFSVSDGDSYFLFNDLEVVKVEGVQL